MEQVLADLIATFASANGTGLGFGFALSKKLLEARLLSVEFTTQAVFCCSEDALFDAITTEPYPRGDYVARLVANRICKAIDQINSEGGTRFLLELQSSNFERASSLLLPLYGVGPKFVENYCILAGIANP